MATSDRGGLYGFFEVLVSYRLLVYAGGLAAIGAPLALAEAGVTLPANARTAIVVVSLGLMVLTYAGERLVGLDAGKRRRERPTEGGDENRAGGYSLRLRVALALAVVGVAAGVYVALEVSVIYGLVFLLGAYLFALVAFRNEEGEGRV